MKTKGNGMIRKRPDGVWEYRVIVGSSKDGKPLRKSFYSKVRAEAIEKYQTYIKENHLIVSGAKTRVKDWAEIWLANYKKESVSYGTYRNYKLYVDNYIATSILGDKNIDEVLPLDVASFISSAKVKKLSASSQNHIYLSLKGIFDAAVDNNLCVMSPVRKPSKKRAEIDYPKFFPRESIDKIIKRAKTHEYGPLVLLLLYTGLRLGELCALKWADIGGDVITVRRAIARTEEGPYAEKAPKSGKARVVIMSDELKPVIDGMQHETDYVLSKNGKPLTLHQAEGFYQTFFSGSGIPYLSPHKCRHTYATYLAASGADSLYIRDLLGHSSIRTTEIYAHVDIDALKENAKKLSYNSGSKVAVEIEKYR